MHCSPIQCSAHGTRTKVNARITALVSHISCVVSHGPWAQLWRCHILQANRNFIISSLYYMRRATCYHTGHSVGLFLLLLSMPMLLLLLLRTHCGSFIPPFHSLVVVMLFPLMLASPFALCFIYSFHSIFRMITKIYETNTRNEREKMRKTYKRNKTTMLLIDSNVCSYNNIKQVSLSVCLSHLCVPLAGSFFFAAVHSTDSLCPTTTMCVY